MKNIKMEYNIVLSKVLCVPIDEVEQCEYKGTETWTSLSHIIIIDMLEDTFNCVFTKDEILDFKTYKDGLRFLLSKFDQDTAED